MFHSFQQLQFIWPNKRDTVITEENTKHSIFGVLSQRFYTETRDFPVLDTKHSALASSMWIIHTMTDFWPLVPSPLSDCITGKILVQHSVSYKNVLINVKTHLKCALRFCYARPCISTAKSRN